MLFSDTYKTITQTAEGEYKDKGSRFIGLAFPVTSEEDIKAILVQVKKEHFSAAHHCYAYVLSPSQQVQKSNDDREPNNTAGKPILRAILGKGLTDVLVVVVRYFGGKLLGVPGLIQAYGEAADLALQQAPVIEKIVREQHEITGDYEHENEMYKLFKAFQASIFSHQYNENRFTCIFDIRKSKAEELIAAIKEKRLFDVTFIKEL